MFPSTRSFGALLIAFAPASALLAQDAYPIHVDVPPFVAMGASYEIFGYVRNTSSTPLTGFTTGWRWNNGPVQRGNFLNLGAGIGTENMAMFTHPVRFEPTMAGRGKLKVWVDGQNDGQRRNDTLTFDVTVLDRWVSKKLLMEVRTSLNCHNCQMARPNVDALMRDPQVLVAKFHHRDDLAVAAADQYFNSYGTDFTPAGVLDQGEAGVYAPNPNHSQWQRHLKGKALGVSPVLCQVVPVLDTLTRTLHVTVAAEFTTAMQGDFSVNALVMLDNVYAPGQGSPWHHGVVRAMLAGPDGDGEVIPEKPVPGITYKVTYDVKLPDGIDPSDLCITGYVTRHDGLKRITLNARDASVDLGRMDEPVAMMSPMGPMDALLSQAPFGEKPRSMGLCAPIGKAVLPSAIGRGRSVA
ncbi:MAG: hypothetical protein KIT10_05825 [Flavobacteriales bacterium]|nr:hypothetical protein [Flavobacteriales bacterium]